MGSLRLFIGVVVFAGCASNPRSFDSGGDLDAGQYDSDTLFDSDSDTDVDTVTDTDTETETGIDIDTDTDIDSDTDTGTDSDSDTDIDTDIDVDTDTDTDTDTDEEQDAGTDAGDTDTDTETGQQCTGVMFEGYCWFLSVDELSCDQMCAAHGALYDIATCDFAGSSVLNCTYLLDVLGVSKEWEMFECDCEGMGCHTLNETQGFSDTCDSSSSAIQSQRVCACTF